MKKLVVIDNTSHTLSKVYFIADVKKYQVITLDGFNNAISTLESELPDIMIVNCDLYKGDFSAFIQLARQAVPELFIIGCSWKMTSNLSRRGSHFSLDAFIKMPMDVRKISLALEAMDYGYALFPAEMFSGE